MSPRSTLFRFRGLLRKHLFLLTATLVPLFIRSIPELIAGPYPIGYDTIGSYVPFMYDWSMRNYQSFNPLIGGWVMYAVFGLAYTYSHVDPIIITKIAATLLYSGLGIVEYAFAQRTLNWSPKKSLSLVLISAVYFATLTLSWDLFRNTLGLILFFPTLSLSQGTLNRLRAILLAGLSWLVIATHLLVGTILLGIFLIEIFRMKDRRLIIGLAVLPSAAQLISSLAAFQFGGTNIVAVEGLTFEQSSAYSYLLLATLPLLPMVLIGLRRPRTRIVMSWALICLIGILAATTPISTSSELVTPERWTLMLVVPLLILATEGVSSIKTSTRREWLRPRGIFKTGWLCTIIVLGVTFLLLPAAQAFPYFAYSTPTSMLQSTVPLEDSRSLVTAISWLSANATTGSAIMADHAMYGWLREYYKGNDTIVAFQPGVTLQYELETTISQGYHNIYTVWWVDDLGWYGEPSVPLGFTAVYVNGQMGVFLYVT